MASARSRSSNECHGRPRSSREHLSRGTRLTPQRSSQLSRARPQPLRLRPLRRGGSNAPKLRANLDQAVILSQAPSSDARLISAPS